MSDGLYESKPWRAALSHFQAGLLLVLLVTLVINVLFILDTSKKLQQKPDSGN